MNNITPFEDLPSGLQTIFIKLVEDDPYGLNPSTLYNNTLLTAQNSGVDKAVEFMHVPRKVVNDILNQN
jgi:hypothetical protein